jgi:hypothetical protein
MWCSSPVTRREGTVLFGPRAAAPVVVFECKI